MKLETIKHPQNTVSCVSEGMAEHFKDKITDAQYEVLKHNVYSIADASIGDKYHGCGCGWVEIDKDGKAIDLQYLDEDIVDWRDDSTGDMQVAVVSSQECQALYMNTGQEEQNVNMLEFHTDQLMPIVLPNGNMRILVNLSCYQLVRF